MSTRIDAIAPTGQAQAAAAAKDMDPKAAHKIKEVSREFEALLVRQMLTAAKLGGEKEGPYNSMAVEAVASAVSRGRGLGIGDKIAEALARETHGAHGKVSK